MERLADRSEVELAEDILIALCGNPEMAEIEYESLVRAAYSLAKTAIRMRPINGLPTGGA